MSAVDGLLCDLGAGFRQGDHAMPAISGIDFNRNNAPHPKSTDNAFGGGGIQADEPPEMILGGGADFGQLGHYGELGLGQIVGN